MENLLDENANEYESNATHMSKPKTEHIFKITSLNTRR